MTQKQRIKLAEKVQREILLKTHRLQILEKQKRLEEKLCAP